MRPGLRRFQRSISEMVSGTGSTVAAPNLTPPLTSGVNHAMRNGTARGARYVTQFRETSHGDNFRFHYYSHDDIWDMILDDNIPPRLLLMWDEREIVACYPKHMESDFTYRVGPVW